MRALGIETSGHVGSVALVEASPGEPDAARVLAEETFEKGLRHGQALVPAIGRILAQAGVSRGDIDLFVAGTGPGSYTGLRVGIAVAKALAYALGKPLLGVPSFDAIAEALPAALLEGCASGAIAVNARTEHVYWGRLEIRAGRALRAGEYDIVAPDRVLADLPRPCLVVGDAGPLYELIAKADGVRLAPPELGHAFARDLAAIGLRRALAGDRSTIAQCLPLYLRASIPEEKRAR